MRERDVARPRDAVDGPLPPLRQLHHEQVGAAFFGQELDDVFPDCVQCCLESLVY